MTVQVNTSVSFSDLGFYLEHGRGQRYVEDPHKRVAFAETRNLYSETRRALVQEMRDAARHSDHVRFPAAHFIISWKSATETAPHADDPTKTEMLSVADEMLRRLGLDEHQAWIVAHKDTDTPHLHLMVNRVHPDKHRAWDMWKSLQRASQVLRDLERERGWAVPAHGKELAERGYVERRPGRRWERKAMREGADSLRAAAANVLEKDLAQADSWRAVEGALENHGLRLTPKRSGFVVGDGETYAALSSITRNVSKQAWERTFNQPWREHVMDKPTRVENASDYPYEMREELRRRVEEGMRDRPTMSRFIERMEEDGQVKVVPNEEGGHVSGLSYQYAGWQIKASQVRRDLSFGRLQEEHGVRYDPKRDLPRLRTARQEDAPKTEQERALAFAADFYRGQLIERNEEHPAKAYLRERRVSEETAERFQLGFAPDGWRGLKRAANAAGFSDETLEQAGLLQQRHDGKGYIDSFRARIIFSVTRRDGQVVGFGARTIDGLEPDVAPGAGKYRNSANTESFQKSEAVFGQHQAAEAAAERGEVFVVEGYMDAVSLHQEGVENVVAVMGTRLPSGRARKVAALAPRATVVLDGGADEQSAQMQATLIEHGVAAAGYAPEEGTDPDDLTRVLGPMTRGALEQGRETYPAFILHRTGESPEARAEAQKWIMDTMAAAPKRLREGMMRDFAAANEALWQRPSTVAQERLRALTIERLRAVHGLEETGLTPPTNETAPTENVRDVYRRIFGTPPLAGRSKKRGRDEKQQPTSDSVVRRAMSERRRAVEAWKERGRLERRLAGLDAKIERLEEQQGRGDRALLEGRVRAAQEHFTVRLAEVYRPPRTGGAGLSGPCRAARNVAGAPRGA